MARHRQWSLTEHTHATAELGDVVLRLEHITKKGHDRSAQVVTHRARIAPLYAMYERAVQQGDDDAVVAADDALVHYLNTLNAQREAEYEARKRRSDRITIWVLGAVGVAIGLVALSQCDGDSSSSPDGINCYQEPTGTYCE